MARKKINGRKIPSHLNRRGRTLSILVCLFASIFIYVLSFPNILASRGCGILIYLALAPIFYALRDCRPATALVAGCIFGAAAFGLSNYWLGNYHSLALVLVMSASALTYGATFFVATLLCVKLKRFRPLVWASVWVVMETLKSSGPFAYPYGCLGYALYTDRGALAIASWAGVGTVSFIVVWTSACVAQAAASIRRITAPSMVAATTALCLFVLTTWIAPLTVRPTRTNASIRVALVQPNIFERQKTVADYRAATDRLIELSTGLLALPGRPDLVVWHETAIVPPIEWHLRRRTDREVYEVADKLMRFFATYPIPILFGNGRAQDDSTMRRVDYNSAKLVLDGSIVAHYDKNRLVPFSERVPFREWVPHLARVIERELGSSWEAGENATVLGPVSANGDQARFGTPICFEDAFQDQCRRLADNGANFLIVLTDDSWARSEACQRQHMAMSCFRAAELGVPVVRATNTGITAHINADGIVWQEAEPFVSTVLMADVEYVATRSDETQSRADLWYRRCIAMVANIVPIALLCMFFSIFVWKTVRGRHARRFLLTSRGE